jgi:integrase
MKQTFNSFEELTRSAADFIRSKLLKADGTVKHYIVLWKKVKRHLESQRINCFSSVIAKQYLLNEFGNRDYAQLSKREKDLVRAVNVLSEFSETECISAVKEQTIFDGSIGLLMREYLSHKTNLRLKIHTIEENQRHLYRFSCFLNENKIRSIKAVTLLHILQFIKSINPQYSTLGHLTLQTLRGFFKYLYEQHHLDINLSGLVPKDNFRKQPKLPSTYSAEEIELMIASIDRGNSTGKRNYCIVLLAARLGLRASDIANLKFENLHWEPCNIVLSQYKTGKKIELPLLPEVGEAIIDYLKYGRPKSNEPFVFLLCRSPFTPIHSSCITGIVHSSLMRAGINIDNRKHGAHTLRHSLASILLEKETTLPIISEILGHENTESTKYYLRIDIKAMRQCALDVPPVSKSFYQQKGGYFYA